MCFAIATITRSAKTPSMVSGPIFPQAQLKSCRTALREKWGAWIGSIVGFLLVLLSWPVTAQTPFPVVTGLSNPSALALDGNDAVVAVLAEDARGHRSAGNAGRADLVADGQHVVEHNDVAGFAGQAFHLDDVVLRDAVLFAAGADDCDHRILRALALVGRPADPPVKPGRTTAIK